MRFNFIAIYSDKFTPVFESKLTSVGSLVSLAGLSETSPAEVGPSRAISGSIKYPFSANEFGVFSKYFVNRSTYFANYNSRLASIFGDFSDYSVYTENTFAKKYVPLQKDLVIKRILETPKQNILFFRSLGMRAGSISFGEIPRRKVFIFCFVRAFSLFKVFSRKLAFVFFNPAFRFSNILDFFNLFKSFFFNFKFFRSSRFLRKLGLNFTFFRIRRMRKKVKLFLRRAFVRLFFFFKFSNFNLLTSTTEFVISNFLNLYESQTIFFASHILFKKQRGRRGYSPLRSALVYFIRANNIFYYATIGSF